MQDLVYVLPRTPYFQAPLCQADAREVLPESATSAPYTASEMRRLRQRIASLRDLPSASFLRWYAPPRGSLRAWQTAIMCMTWLRRRFPASESLCLITSPLEASIGATPA